MIKVSCLLLSLLMGAILPAWAEPPLLPAKKPAVNKPAPKPSKLTYQDWLKRYNAWDKLEKEYGAAEHTPENIIKQARVAMNAGDPNKALQIVESVAPFEDNSVEIDRLWVGAQAWRALGLPDRSVLWFVGAADLMKPEERVQRLTKEPGLAMVWKDVFRKLFQVYIHNNNLSREAQGVYLSQVIGHGASIWINDKFWKVVKSTLEKVQTVEPAKAKDDLSRLSKDINKIRIAQAIATVVEGYSDWNGTLIDMADKDRSGFWIALLSLIENNDQPSLDLSKIALQAIRVQRFLEHDFDAAATMLASNWIQSSNTLDFKQFKRNCRLLSMQELHELFINGSPESLMIGFVAADELLPLRLGVSIAVNDRQEAEKIWKIINKTTLPNGLRLASMFYFNQTFKDAFNRGPDFGSPNDLLWLTLLEAAGNAPFLPHLVPFWQPVVPEKDRLKLIYSWPLDPDVMFKVWKYDWNRRSGPNLARRVAYLYPDEQFGMLCTLFLAENSLGNNQFNLAQYYLSGVDTKATNSTLTAEYYRVKAELQISREDIDGAYESYQQLVGTGAPIDDTTRLKIAFLLQQRGELEQGRKHLLTLWEKREQYETPMQAEILFYLAEGEQAMNNSDQALDYYLHLAWKYPQESMWALTAMYRASNIYESLEQYEPAVRLLKTVVKNAETPKQRETATLRLENIQARQAKDTEHGAGSVPYPF